MEMKRKFMVLLLSFALCALAGAGEIPVANQSFEVPAVTANTWNWSDQAGTGVDVIEDWNYDYTGAAWPSANDTGVFTTSAGPSSDGTPRVSFVRHSTGQAAEQVTGPWQDLSYTIAAGNVYVFTMDVQRRQSGTACSLTFNYHDGGTRTEIIENLIDMTGQANDGWATYSLSFAAVAGEPYIGKSLGIEFNNESTSDSWQHFDYVRVRVADEPGLIYPVDVENQPWDLTLEWLAPPTFTPGGYNIYLDPNELEVTNRNPGTKCNTVIDPDPNHDVTGLAHGMRYYWLVEARQDPVTTPPTDPNWIPSVVATFTTAPDEPIITTHPESQTVAATTEVILTVEADNATGYQWYKDGISLLGKTDPSLTLTSVALGDEGYYRCDVSNASDTVSSDTARLMIQRLVGQWTFEETIDAVVGDFTGTYVDPNVLAHGNVPVYDADAMEGSWAINFPGPDLEGLGEHIAVSDPNFFDFYPQGFTASVWIKTTFTANWSGYVSKHHRTPDAGWIIYSDGNVAVATMRSAWTGDHYGSTTVTDGEWHLLVNQYDPVAKVLRLYVDGELENTSGTVGGALPVTTSGTPVLIGADRPGGSFSANGLVDDVRIWNHALDPVTIAYLYTDATGETVCTSDDGTAGPMDFNEDCIVNIKDLAEFAAKWLECYIVPTCLP